MRILYWGTPAYAVPTLRKLHQAGHTIVGVVSQPDRRRGRGQQLVASAVKQEALNLNLPVFTPERIKKDPDCQAQLAALKADASVVVAFGQILRVGTTATGVLERSRFIVAALARGGPDSMVDSRR